LLAIEAFIAAKELNGGSSEMVEDHELTSLAVAEKARLWAAPVNALRAANMMRCDGF